MTCPHCGAIAFIVRRLAFGRVPLAIWGCRHCPYQFRTWERGDIQRGYRRWIGPVEARR